MEAILYTPDLLRSPEGVLLLGAARAAGIAHFRVSEGLMARVTTTRPVPGVVAAVWASLRDVAHIEVAGTGPLLIAEAIANPDNLGMVLRTADAAGIAGVVLIGESSDPFHKHCIRAARGAVGRLPIYVCHDPQAYLCRLRHSSYQILGATARAATELYSCEMTLPLAVVVGNEQVGISPGVLTACTEQVRIPMAPGQDSLNVGVASGVLLYELLRQRIGTSGSRPTAFPAGGEI